VVRRGGIYGLLGHNGSGKTTTMRMVLAVLPPDEGLVRVLGCDRPADAKRRVGYLPEDRGLYKDMRVGEFVAYMARLRAVPARGLGKRVEGWLDRVGLADKRDERCGVLSRGQQQRVQAVAALVHEPELLVLDEPFNGLDPVNRRILSEVFAQEHARGCTLVLSTHLLAHAEEVCDHIVMMDAGEKVLDAPLHELRTRSRTVACEPVDPGADPAPLASLGGVASVRRTRRGFDLELEPEVDAAAFLARAAATVPMTRIEVVRQSLEDVFVRIVAERGGAA
jgi:ABC-2 type transport system ATP-binding protein